MFDYVDSTVSPSVEICYYNFENIGSTNTVLLGQPFITQFYTIFDPQNQQIGLGMSYNNQQPNSYIYGPKI